MYEPGDKKIFFFGDSICFGQGVAVHKGWVTRISAMAEEMVTAMPFGAHVFNPSISGNTTRQALERMPFDVQAHGVDILVTQFGMNDCNYWQTDGGVPRVSPEAFLANMKEIITRGRLFGAQTIIVNTNHPTTRTDEPFAHKPELTYQQSNEAYNRLVREAVGSFQDETIILNDVEKAVEEGVAAGRFTVADLVLNDGLHLSEAGHDLYFACMAPLMRRAVEAWGRKAKAA